jgi:hypothetical protein
VGVPVGQATAGCLLKPPSLKKMVKKPLIKPKGPDGKPLNQCCYVDEPKLKCKK